MNNKGFIIADVPLVPDPDADEEMGTRETSTITDEEIRGCRLVLLQRAARPIRIDNHEGGIVAFHCTFHPAPDIRYTSARVSISLNCPKGISIIDLQPRLEVGEPVSITHSREGTLVFKYPIGELGGGGSQSVEYEKKFCTLQGSGVNTSKARWDFSEDKVRQAGIVREQTLALTLPIQGEVKATLTLSARIVRAGLRGRLEAFRDLIASTGSGDRQFSFSFEIPSGPPADQDNFTSPTSA